LFFGEGGAGTFYEEGNDVEEVTALFVDLALALTTRAAFYYLQDAFQLALAT
jgi:TPR repeat protein